MTVLHIVWKDNELSKTCPAKRFRDFTIERYGKGWTISVPDDKNIYSSVDCAMNAIDAYYGNFGRPSVTPKRLKHGIKIIGTKK